jgi:predicted membrane protein
MTTADERRRTAMRKYTEAEAIYVPKNLFLSVSEASAICLKRYANKTAGLTGQAVGIRQHRTSKSRQVIDIFTGTASPNTDTPRGYCGSVRPDE